MPAAGGTIGLRDDRDDVDALREPFEDRNRERTGSKKYGFQRVNAASASARSSGVSAGRRFFALSM
jgi:hypothetical protein